MIAHKIIEIVTIGSHFYYYQYNIINTVIVVNIVVIVVAVFNVTINVLTIKADQALPAGEDSSSSCWYAK